MFEIFYHFDTYSGGLAEEDNCRDGKEVKKKSKEMICLIA